MEAAPEAIDEILILLAETPQRIALQTAGLDNACLNAKLEPNSWSANDILAHLRACADVWGKIMLAMIAQDHPTLRYISPRTWIRKTNYTRLDFQTSFAAFSSQRESLLMTLKSLDRVGWQRAATFTGTTKGREETVFSYARRLALHERDHCEQIEALLA
jgi:hypothetical protein